MQGSARGRGAGHNGGDGIPSPATSPKLTNSLRHNRVTALPAAHFPDAFVFPFPVVAQPVHQPPQVRPTVISDGCHVLVDEIGGIQQLAVDVQLQLPIGAVADARGTGTLVAIQVVWK